MILTYANGPLGRLGCRLGNESDKNQIIESKVLHSPLYPMSIAEVEVTSTTTTTYSTSSSVSSSVTSTTSTQSRPSLKGEAKKHVLGRLKQHETNLLAMASNLEASSLQRCTRCLVDVLEKKRREAAEQSVKSVNDVGRNVRSYWGLLSSW